MRSFLRYTNPDLELDPLVVPEDCLHFKVDADGRDEGRGEGIIGIAEEEGGLADRRVTDDQQLEHVVEVLIRRVLLPFWILSGHLRIERKYVLVCKSLDDYASI